MKTMVFGGERLATEQTGPGKVYFQTKNIREFWDFLGLDQKRETMTSATISGGTAAGAVVKGLLKV
jgi:uncharacterized protein (AIM24 family)